MDDLCEKVAPPPKADEEVHLVEEGDCEENWERSRLKREIWSGKLEFILSCIGFCVGLGNVWRFPYLCYRNGGGAFLVPYVLFMLVCAIPLVMLELSLGQFSSLSPGALFSRFCPLFQGVGWSMMIVQGIVAIYYNVILTWALYYLYLSLSNTLPWTTCSNWWNTPTCVMGIGGLGSNISSEWRFLFLIREIVYITATVPYMLLVVLLVRGLLLPGALDGIRLYLVPDWSKLLELSVWQDAGSQIFFSVCMCWGGLIVFASYNKFNHNIYRDAILLPVINCGTSVFAGFVVFAIIGFMSHESGQPIEHVVAGGPGLLFVVYPEAVSHLPLSPVWSVLFFTLILLIGVDSQFGNVESIRSTLIDAFPKQFGKMKIRFTFILCFIMFLTGIPCVMQGGVYVLQLLDWYTSSIVIMIIAICECFMVAYVYGYRRFMMDIQLMTNSSVFMFFPIAWLSITPLVTGTLLLLSFTNITHVTYGNYQYPNTAIVIGWFIATISIVPIPAFAIYNMRYSKGTFRENLLSAVDILFASKTRMGSITAGRPHKI